VGGGQTLSLPPLLTQGWAPETIRSSQMIKIAGYRSYIEEGFGLNELEWTLDTAKGKHHRRVHLEDVEISENRRYELGMDDGDQTLLIIWDGPEDAADQQLVDALN
jgi:hypothetical protein